LKLQVPESEHPDSSKDSVLPNGNVIRSGIEFDKTGKRVACCLYREHQGECSLLTNLNIFKPLRPGQIRGEPWLSNVLLKLHELDQYEDAEPVRKKTAAMFAGFVTRPDPESGMFGEGDADSSGAALAGLEPGTMQFPDPGEDVKFSSYAIDNQTGSVTVESGKLYLNGSRSGRASGCI
jgi:lambda family phage portal protein